MVEQVLALAEDVAAEVAAVLDAARVDGDVLAEAVEAGELAAADPAPVEAALVLRHAAVRQVVGDLAVDLVGAGAPGHGGLGLGGLEVEAQRLLRRPPGARFNTVLIDFALDFQTCAQL